MSCHRFGKYLIPYAEGTLSEKLSRALEKHLTACESCARELESLSCVVDVLKTTEYPAMEPAHDLRSRVMARIADEPVRIPWWRSSKLPAWSAAAAGLVLFAFLAVNLETGLQKARNIGPSQEATSEVQLPNSPSAGVLKEKAETKPEESSGKWVSPTTVTNKRYLMPKDKEGRTGVWIRLDPPKPMAEPGRTRRVEKLEATKDDRLDEAGVAAESWADKLAKAEGKMAGYEKGSPIAVTPRGGGNLAVPSPDVAASEAPGPAGPAGFAANPNAPEGASRFESQTALGGKQQVQVISPEAEPYSTDDDRRNVFYMGNAIEQPDEKVKAASESARVLGLERKLKEHPTSITVLRDLRKAYKETGRAKDEYAVTERLTSLDPNNAQYWFERAQAAEWAKMPKTAMTCYKRALNFKLPSPNLDLAQSRLKALENAK